MPTRPLRDLLGLPNVQRRRAVLAAAVIDSLGSGLFLPFAVVYFLHTTPLGLATVGFGLSAASALVIPLVPVAGVAVDRFGAVQCVVAASLLQMVGFVAYLWVGALWQLVAFALLAAAGRRLFWTANGAFVQLVADAGEAARWFGLLRALRNGGYALGGALAAVALGLASQTAYQTFVVLNAVTFLAAGLLVAGWSRRPAARRPGRPAAQPAADQPGRPDSRPRVDRPGQREPQPDADQPATDRLAADRPDAGQPGRRADRRSGYRAVLADRRFLVLLAVSFLFVLCTLAVDVLLTVYLTSVLHQPAWLAGVLFTLNATVIVAAQTVITRGTERRSQTRVLQLAAALWAVSFVLMWAVAAAPAAAVVPGLVAAMLCFTAAEAVAMPTLNTLVLALALAPAGRQGRYFAAQGLSWIVPQTIAPAAFTWQLDHGTGWPWVTLLLGMGVSAAALAHLRRALPADAGQATEHDGAHAAPVPAAKEPVSGDKEPER